MPGADVSQQLGMEGVMNIIKPPTTNPSATHWKILNSARYHVAWMTLEMKYDIFGKRLPWYLWLFRHRMVKVTQHG